MEHNEIVKAIIHRQRAMYNGHEYTVHGVRGYKELNKPCVGYAVELLDKNQNSIIYAALEEAKLLKLR